MINTQRQLVLRPNKTRWTCHCHRTISYINDQCTYVKRTVSLLCSSKSDDFIPCSISVCRYTDICLQDLYLMRVSISYVDWIAVPTIQKIFLHSPQLSKVPPNNYADFWAPESSFLIEDLDTKNLMQIKRAPDPRLKWGGLAHQRPTITHCKLYRSQRVAVSLSLHSLLCEFRAAHSIRAELSCSTRSS